jgi:hypothetical protein
MSNSTSRDSEMNTSAHNELIDEIKIGFVLSLTKNSDNYIAKLHDNSTITIPKDHPIIKSITIQTFPPQHSTLYPGLNDGIAQAVFNSGRIDWYKARICVRASASYYINNNYYDIHDNMDYIFYTHKYKNYIEKNNVNPDSVKVSSWPVAGIYSIYFDNLNIWHNIHELKDAIPQKDGWSKNNTYGYVDFIYITRKELGLSIIYIQKTTFDKELIYKNEPI